MTEITKNNEEISEFIDLLLHFSKNEKLMDINRCLLAQDLYFDISSLYNYISFKFSEEKNVAENIITLSTLKKFISIDLDIEIDPEILSKIFDFYSKPNFYEGERYLDYLEFTDIFYPRYNLTLRKYLQQRNGLNKEIKSLNSITKMLLQKLFIMQINIIKYLIHYNDRMNINCKDLFNLISNNKIFITRKDLTNLFTKENIPFTKEDIESIIIGLSYNNRHFYSNNDINIVEGIYYKSFENIFNIEKKIFQEKPLTFEEKISVMKSIITQTIYQEKKVEEAKTFIVKREDFNFNFLLNFFNDEKNDKSKDKIEFNNFLKKLDLSLDKNEQELLLRRIDLLRKRYLYNSDIFEFFVPLNNEYRDKIKSDLKKNINMNHCFSKGTMIYINNLINVVVKGEKEINEIKKKISNDDEFIEYIFNEICHVSNNNKSENLFINNFNEEKLYTYLKEKLNMTVTEYEVNLFFVRLDKLRRRKVQILEFSDEMNYINFNYY